MSEKYIKIKCFVALFDILGFGKLIEDKDKDNELNRVADTYIKMKKAIDDKAQYIEQIKEITVRSFSDTFLIYTCEADKLSFRALLTVCDFLFSAANENNLPIRGATAFGDLIVSESMEIGRPIIDAFKREQEQDWIGCWISDDCLTTLESFDKVLLEEGTIIQYNIPLKNKDTDERYTKRGYAFNYLASIPNTIKLRHKEKGIDEIITLEDVRNEINLLKETPTDSSIRIKHTNTRKFIDFVLNEKFFNRIGKGLVRFDNIDDSRRRLG